MPLLSRCSLLVFALWLWQQPATNVHVNAPLGVVNPIAADRRVEWSTAGATIDSVRTLCYEDTGALDTAATLNTQIGSCAADTYIQLQTGTYALTTGLLFNGDNNVSLRGTGPDTTILDFSGTNSCGGLTSSICIKASTNLDIDAPPNTRNWTAGLSKGSTVITLAAVTNLSVGQIILLDQLDDTGADNGEIWIGDTAGTHCSDCASPSRGGNRAQQQAVRVTAINGTDVTIDPPIMWPNFVAGSSPQAVYTSGTAITGVGLENLAIDTEDAGAGALAQSVTLYQATNSWLKNVRIVHLGEKGVRMYLSTNITVRDSFFYDKQGTDASQEGSESYGVDAYMASAWLIENNIANHITSPWQCESGVGGVIAYNYSFDDFYNLTNTDWAQASSYIHGVCAYLLFEGNDGFGFISDNVHSGNYFHTNFRNRYQGYETGSAYTLQTVAIHIYATNRFQNVLGNVLGDNAYHNRYESFTPTATDCDTSIYALGWGGNCGTGAIASTATVRSSLLRWGNYDTVNDNVRWEASEVPTADGNYPNTLPSAQAVPNSLYLSAEPSFFGAIPWPPIGPEVTGGNVTGLGGHVNKIPARVCYEAGVGGVSGTTFDATGCY